MRIRTLAQIIICVMLADFIVRGVVPSISTGKNDFTDPFVGAWLWRHELNPYNPALATAAAESLGAAQSSIVPIYPPTTFVLVAPFTRLSWPAANVLLSVLGVIAVCGAAWCILRLSGRTLDTDLGWIILALTLGFASFHTSIHVGNISAISCAFALLAVYLESRNRDTWAGLSLALATCLKPHLGLWLLVFYAVKRKWSLLISAVIGGATLSSVALVKIWLPPVILMTGYRSNLQHWFGRGGENDASLANPLRYQLANFQLVLEPLIGHSAATAMIWLVVGVAGVVWLYFVWRSPRTSTALAASALISLSFLPVYHRVYDTGILTLALAWMFKRDDRMNSVKWTAFGLFLLLLLPIQSIVSRWRFQLSPAEAHSWWWNLVVVPYTSWVLLLFSAVLLYALWNTPQSGPSSPASDDRLLAHAAES